MILISKDELKHYASPYYDPVKAHEYYMRTRQLKGRRSTSKLNDEGKKIWSYTKNQISEEKKGKLEEAKTAQSSSITAARTRASETRERITSRLKRLNESLSSSEKNRLEQIRSHEKSVKRMKAARKDATVQKVMNRLARAQENMSGDDFLRFKSQQNDRLGRLISDTVLTDEALSEKYSKERADVKESAAKQRAQYASNAASERTKVASELKSSISAIREAYAATKESLNSEYETTFQQEYDRILAEYGKPEKSKKTGSGKSKSSKKSDGNKKLYKFSSTTAKHETYKNA